MIKNVTSFKHVLNCVSTLTIIIASHLSYAQDPVTVTAKAVHYGGNIQYTYQVTNHTVARKILRVNIGDRGEQASNPNIITNIQPELEGYPVNSYWGPPTEWGDQRGTSLRLGGMFTSPPGWAATIHGYEETHKFSINWDRVNQLDPGILPGRSYSFSVSVPARITEPTYYTMGVPAYVNGHFTVWFSHSKTTDEGPAFWSYTGPIVALDTTPPILTLSLSPNKLWPPNEKLVPITATISVKDDYDPQPEIKFESITANEVIDEDDIKGILYGTDDRQFLLKAEREGKNRVGRTYTLTYSATDASGNKSTASATVTVPQDEREHESRDKDEKKHDRHDEKDKHGNKRDR